MSSDEEPCSPCPSSWVSMATRVRHHLPQRNMLYEDLMHILNVTPSYHEVKSVKSLKELSINIILGNDELAWHLSCSCPAEMFDYVMEMFIKELARRYQVNSGQRLQYNLTRSIVHLSLHCIHNSFSLIHFLRQIKNLFDTNWFRWTSCRYHTADDVSAMWAFYAELADAMAVGYVVPRLYERKVPVLPNLDLSGIPRLRDSTWSLKTIYDAGKKELHPLLSGSESILKLTMDLEIEGVNPKQLRLLNKLAMDRRIHKEGEGGKFLLGVKHVYVTSLPVDNWNDMLMDIATFPELSHLTLNMCSLTSEFWSEVECLGHKLTGLSLPNNPDLTDFSGLKYFPYLTSLDLSNCNLCDKLDPVIKLASGLTYLGLSCCHLSGTELEALSTSKHCNTLMQLDVSENSAKNNTSMYCSYFKLFSLLKKIEVLNVSNCHIPDHEDDLQNQVKAALQSMTSLKLIAFSTKDFANSTTLTNVFNLMDCRIFYTV